MPCTLPQRITKDLVRMLGSFSPVFLNIHFNHPSEITEQAADACAKMADAGIPLGSQTVLLKGVNDNVNVMHRLMGRLLAIRVRPYYLHQLDRVQGTSMGTLFWCLGSPHRNSPPGPVPPKWCR